MVTLVALVGNGDGRHQRLAVGGDHLALAVEVEATVARVRGGAVRPRHLEEPLARDRQVKLVSRLVEVALRVDHFRRDRVRSQPDLQTRGQRCCCSARNRA